MPPRRTRTITRSPPRLPETSPSLPREEDPLVSRYDYPDVSILTLRLPMLRSVNRQHKFSRKTGWYIDPSFRSEMATFREQVESLCTAVRWQTSPADSYVLFYTFTFSEKVGRRRTGDNHNPLKPISDMLVQGGALYDDDNVRGEWVESHREAGDTHYATVVIYRFPDPDTRPTLPLQLLFNKELTTSHNFTLLQEIHYP